MIRNNHILATGLCLLAAVACSTNKNSNEATEPQTATDSDSSDPNNPGVATGPVVDFKSRYIHFIGRTVVADHGVLMAWGGATAAVRVNNGTKLTLGLLNEERGQNNMVGIYVDGTLKQTFTVNDSQSTYQAALPAGDHVVHVIKRTEAGNGVFFITSMQTDGQFELPPSNNDRLIEFIGENAFAGQAVDGNKGQYTCNQPINSVADPAIQNAYDTVGVLTAKAFNADWSILAYSTRGVAQNYDGASSGNLIYPGSTGLTMPQIWDRNDPLDANNMASFVVKANVVVVNLGTNDLNYGMVNGAAPPDQTAFVSAYSAFLTRVRGAYADAHIIATVGPNLSSYQCFGAAATGATGSCQTQGRQSFLGVAQTYVKAAVAQLNDSKISYLDFVPNTADASCTYMPDKDGHAAMAKTLIPAIAAATGWQANQTVAASAPTGLGPQRFMQVFSAIPDPLLNAGDPNLTGINPGQYPNCHYCSPRPVTTVSSCPTVIGTSMACQGFCHEPSGFVRKHSTNPPVTGDHYPSPEGGLGEHTSAVPRGNYLHTMEHGGVVIAYNCPSGCDSELAVIREAMAPRLAKSPKDWVLLTPDPLISGSNRFAAMSWGWLYSFDKPDAATLECFFAQHLYNGRECKPAAAQGGTPNCPSLNGIMAIITN